MCYLCEQIVAQMVGLLVFWDGMAIPCNEPATHKYPIAGLREGNVYCDYF